MAGRRLAHLALLAASGCSFLSDFPEVERLDEATGGAPSSGSTSSATSSSTTESTSSASGGGSSSTGTGGTGGTGGGEACPGCRDCFPGLAPCPDEVEAFVVLGVASNPDPDGPPEATRTTIEITDVAVLSGGDGVVVGNASSRDTAVAVEVTGRGSITSRELRVGVGFVLAADGEVIASATPCSEGDDPVPNPDEAFLMAAAGLPASAPSDVVVAGAFEAHALSFAGATPTCEGQRVSRTGPLSDQVTPFIAWLTADGSLERSLASDTDALGYLADVAAFPGRSDGAVVAIGAANGTPWAGQAVELDLDGELFLVSSAGNSPSAVVGLDRLPCDGSGHTATYSGLRTSVAVDPDDNVWAAGVGCSIVGGDLQSFVVASPSTNGIIGPPPANRVLSISSPDGGVAVTEIAVTQGLVVIAGTYDGTPTIGGTRVSESGLGSGFVAAFPRDGWTNDAELAWFRQLGGAGGNVTVRGLVIDGDRILATGAFVESLGIDGVQACFSSANLHQRSFLAALDLDGRLEWLRVDGFEVAGTSPLQSLVQGAAVGFDGGDLLAVASSHGPVRLTCEGGTVGSDERPRATVRRLTFPPR